MSRTKPVLVVLTVALATVLVAALTAGCSSTRPFRDQATDAGITAKVKSKIAADPEVNPFRIDVDTTDGVVTLRGKVEKEGARTEAEQLAANTGGVTSVRNLITVVGPDADGSYLSDKGIAAKVKSKLTADPQLNPFNIDVDVEDGHVTLSGAVRSATARAEAEKLAADTGGVVGVTNELTVVPHGGGAGGRN